jgi:Transposase DDE domain group 1
VGEKQSESFDGSDRVVLDMDSSESPVHGEQEGSAYNGHFESVCYHPLFLFNSHGDCLAAKLRPGNVHSAEDWGELLLPEIERQQAEGKQVAFRADAAFAKPEIYEALEDNLWRRLVLPKRIDAWSLTSLQQHLVKTGGRLVKHARYYWLLLAESHLTRRRFGTMLQRIWRCRCRPGSARTEGAKYEAKGEESEQCLRTRSRDSKRGLSDVQERAVGIPPISLEPVLLRNLLWRG